jgi:glycine cleavage system H protein
MEGFNYSNIFETKGIEYIAIITFFIVLIPFWIMLNKRGAIKDKINKVLNIFSIDILKIPQGVFHSKNHTWAHMEKSGTASIGLDDFLIHTIGEVNVTKLKESGEIISKGDLLTELQKGDKILKIFSPISGKVLQANMQLNETPELLNNDPYGKGWIYKIKPAKWVEETQSCYIAEDSTNWTKIELQRVKDFLAQTVKKYSNDPSLVVLQDGGELVDFPLSEQPNVVWHDFQDKFLNI